MKAKLKQPDRPGMATLSLCMIVKNEAQTLGDCLRSIKPAVDEIIVVDTGSTDTSKTIARGWGAQIFDFPWCDDFAAARNASLIHATGDYILWLDADDRIDANELKKIQQLKTRFSKHKNQSFFLTVLDESLEGEKILFRQLRIFPNLPQARFEWRVHEQIARNLENAGVTSTHAEIVVRHTGNHDADGLQRKAERNLAIIEDELLKEPENPVMHYHAGRALSVLNRQAEGIAHMQKVVENPEIKRTERAMYLEAGLLLGRYYNEIGNPDAAAGVLQALIREYPDTMLAHFYLGESLLRLGQFADAVKSLENTIRIPIEAGYTPMNLALVRFHQYYMLGMAYEKLGKLTEAKAMFLKTLGSHPEQHKSLQALGLLCLHLGQASEAVGYLEQAVAQGGCLDGYYSDLGVAYFKDQQWGKAETAFMQALELNPDRIEALANLGYLFLEKKDYASALQSFTRAELLGPDLLDLKLALSEIHCRLNQLEKVVKYCEALLLGLGLAVNRQLENLESLAGLYVEIGSRLLEQNRQELARMAYQVAFLLYPLPEALARLLPLAPTQARLKQIMELVQASLPKLATQPILLQALQNTLQQFLENPQAVELKTQSTAAWDCPPPLRSLEAYRQYHLKNYQSQQLVDQTIAEAGKNQTEWLQPGYCEVCEKKVSFKLDWEYSDQKIPNFRERVFCPECGLNNRQRLMLAYIKHHLATQTRRSFHIGVYERNTAFCQQAAVVLKSIQVQELGELGCPAGAQEILLPADPASYCLTATLDILCANDVLEYAADISASLQNAVRVLCARGQLLFSLPFNFGTEKISYRAGVDNGRIVHYQQGRQSLQPDAKLVFADFGWDVLQLCREAGFKDAYALPYFNQSRGYLGAGAQLLFVAEKA